MRVIPLSLFIFVSCLSFNSNALEPVMESHLMLYYQIPLGGNKIDQRKHSYGFRMDRTIVKSRQPIDYQQLLKQTPMFDIKMGHDGIKALNISGIDYLKKYTVSHANGDEKIIEESTDVGEEVMSEEYTDAGEEVMGEEYTDAGEEVMDEESTDVSEEIMDEESTDVSEEIMDEESTDVSEEIMDEKPANVVKKDIIVKDADDGPVYEGTITDILNKTSLGMLFGIVVGIVIFSGVGG